VILLTCSMTLISFFENRGAYTRELRSEARMVAIMLAERGNPSAEAASAQLKAATANPWLELGCAFNSSGATLGFVQGAGYSAGLNVPLTCDKIAHYDFGMKHIAARVNIVDPDLPKPIGSVVLVAGSPSVQWYFGLWLIIAIILSLLLAMVCWLLGNRLHRAVLKPIRQIATTAQRVSLYKDYSLRVVAGSLTVMPREIESLTDSFNVMLHEIEDRDTRLTRKTVEVDKARIAAESANLAKSQFLANVSHELRTPLNAVIGFSTMLSEEQFGPLGSPKYAEYARDIRDSGRHLLDVINDILDLSKAESGKLSIKYESLNLAKIVEKALHIIAAQAHTRRIDIYTDMPEKLPKIFADRVRLVQIFLNLLSNAIKFTAEGGKVVIRAAAESGKNNVHFFTITVEDNGIGMSEADLRKAFSTFNQADAGLNRRYEGAGLGLPLTKRLVELHHGRIKIDSVEGQGTTVTVRLTSDPALLD
jgi:signal transduction histidine kinase